MVYIIISLLPIDIDKGKSGVLHALRAPGSWNSQIFRQSAHEGSKAVRPTHRPPLISENISLISWVDFEVVLGAMWMTTSGIEPTTFRFVAQGLRQLRYQTSCSNKYVNYNSCQKSSTKYYTKLRPKYRETLVEDRVAKIQLGGTREEKDETQEIKEPSFQTTPPERARGNHLKRELLFWILFIAVALLHLPVFRKK